MLPTTGSMVSVLRTSAPRGKTMPHLSSALSLIIADTYTISPELAWLGTETNQFGTDEFMKWCEVLGTEPYLCFNFGTGTLDEGMHCIHIKRIAYMLV